MSVVDETGPLLAATMTPPYQAVLASRQPEVGQALPRLIERIQAEEWSLPGVLGPTRLAKQFARLWAIQTGVTYMVAMRQGIYALRRVIPPPELPGRLRVAGSRDEALLREWVIAFNREALGVETPAAADLVRRRLQAQEFYLWEVAGRVVSMAAKSRPTRRGVTVNAVYTPPAERGQGYASAGVAALSQRLLDEGRQFCTLYTDLDNPTSNHIYRAIGYEPVAESRVYRWESEE